LATSSLTVLLGNGLTPYSITRYPVLTTQILRQVRMGQSLVPTLKSSHRLATDLVRQPNYTLGHIVRRIPRTAIYIRRTAISMWFANGMSEYEVMRLAGHSDFSTMHKYYLAVADDLVDRARVATAQGFRQKLVRFGTSLFEMKKRIDSARRKSLYCNELRLKRS